VIDITFWGHGFPVLGKEEGNEEKEAPVSLVSNNRK